MHSAAKIVYASPDPISVLLDIALAVMMEQFPQLRMQDGRADEMPERIGCVGAGEGRGWCNGVVQRGRRLCLLRPGVAVLIKTRPTELFNRPALISSAFMFAAIE